MTGTEPDGDVTPGLGAALADPDDPLLLSQEEWELVLRVADLAQRRGLPVPVPPAGDPITRAEVAERERIAGVAAALGAHYHDPDGGRSAPFADLLRGARA